MKTCTTFVQSLSLSPLLCLQNVLKNTKFDILLLLYYISKFTKNTQWPHNNKIPRYRQLPFSNSGSSRNCIKNQDPFILHQMGLGLTFANDGVNFNTLSCK